MKCALAAFTVLAGCSLSASAAPTVTKVEPPDWPVEPNGVTLRMLVTGTGLAGTRVRCGFATGMPVVSQSGTHIFFDLTIPKNARPGKYPVTITTAAGSVEAPFAVLPASPAAGRFQGFSSDDVMYLIMPDRFANGDPSNDDPEISRGLFDRSKSRYYHGGDFEGIIRHLPYLKDLGVTALWLTPIYDNNNRLNELERYDGQAITDYHGYGAVDYYAADEHFGTLDKFRELVDKAHAAGIKIIQDQVANHTGPYHPWAKDPPTTTWFHGTVAQHTRNAFRIWTLTQSHSTPQTRATTLDGWFIGLLPDLNQDDPECRRYLIQNTLWWIGRTGIDGIRQDTLPYVPRDFWRDWTAAIKRRYPKFNVVGEVFDSDPAIEAYFQGGRTRDGVDSGIDTLFDFPLHSVIQSVFTGGAKTIELPRLLAHDFLYPDPNRLVTFVDLHDIPRFMSDPKATPGSLERVFGFLMTTRGIPLIYYGDEIGMQGGGDPDNRRDFPGGWKEDAQNAFEAPGRTPEQQRLFESVRRVAHVRAELEPLRRGAMVDLLVADDVYVFARVGARGSVLVALNNGPGEALLHISLAGSRVADGALLKGALDKAPPTKAQAGFADVRIPARSIAIYH
jgi:neopullulanase